MPPTAHTTEHHKLIIERQEVEYESLSAFFDLQPERWHTGWHIEGSYWHAATATLLVTWERTVKP